MTGTLVVFAVLILLAFWAGYWVGQTDLRGTRRSADRIEGMGYLIQQADMDRPGNPLLN